MGEAYRVQVPLEGKLILLAKNQQGILCPFFCIVRRIIKNKKIFFKISIMSEPYGSEFSDQINCHLKAKFFTRYIAIAQIIAAVDGRLPVVKNPFSCLPNVRDITKEPND